MSPQRPPARIAVNVMRARLTLVGFNLAIVTFQLGAVRDFAGGVDVTGLERTVHLSADVALLVAFALSVAAMVLFIAAGALDPVGVVDHPAVVAGDLCMYLALAQSVAGFFIPIVASLREVLAALDVPGSSDEVLLAAVVVTGGVGWALAFYVGPVVSLARSPFTATSNRLLVAIYVALLACLAAVNGLARTIETAATPGLAKLLSPLAHPLQW